MSIFDLNKDINPDEIKKNFETQLSGEGICIETFHTIKDGTCIPVEVTSAMINFRNQKILQSFVRDMSERREREEEKEKLIAELKSAVDEIQALRGILPLCSFC